MVLAESSIVTIDIITDSPRFLFQPLQYFIEHLLSPERRKVSVGRNFRKMFRVQTTHWVRLFQTDKISHYNLAEAIQSVLRVTGRALRRLCSMMLTSHIDHYLQGSPRPLTAIQTKELLNLLALKAVPLVRMKPC